MEYKEKLRLAKEALESGSYDRNTIEYIFPELKESENEKIRRELLESFKHQQRESRTDAEWLNGIKLSEVVSWLEKQKETIPDEATKGNKYILTDETIDYHGHKLYRIKAIKSFNGIRKGSLGGWVESEDNLSQEGDCWILHEAKVFRNAKVSENAKVKDNACIYGNARVRGSAKISGNAEVYGNVCIYDYVSISGYAKVFGSISICGYAEIRGDAEIKFTNDYAVFENIYSTSGYFTWTRSNNMWAVGCFYGTGKELIKRGYRSSELNGKCCEVIVKAQEEVLKLSKQN